MSHISKPHNTKLSSHEYSSKIETLNELKKGVQNLGGLGNGNVGTTEWNER